MRKALLILFCLVLATVSVLAADVADRSVKVCVSATAVPEVRAAADKVLAAVASNPLLAVMAGKTVPSKLTESETLLKAKPEERGFYHLVLVGMPDDPLIKQAWQREARMTAQGIYVFGFGHLAGNIGYLESDRNPFLYSAAIASAPYETEVVTLTGTTPQGVALAVDAFLRQGLVNGVVAQAGWTRPQGSLLDRDPLATDFTLPAWVPAKIGTLQRIAVSQAAEDEYRGVLADAGVAPREIWRVKYYTAGAWDDGDKNAETDYLNGLHRRAYGNTLWLARFASPDEAAAVKGKVAARLGKMLTQQRGEWLIIANLPVDAATLQTALGDATK